MRLIRPTLADRQWLQLASDLAVFLEVDRPEWSPAGAPGAMPGTARNVGDASLRRAGHAPVGARSRFRSVCAERYGPSSLGPGPLHAAPPAREAPAASADLRQASRQRNAGAALVTDPCRADAGEKSAPFRPVDDREPVGSRHGDEVSSGPAGHSRAYWTYRGLSGFINALPSPLLEPAARLAGLSMSRLWHHKRPVIRANLRRVVGPGVSEAALEKLVTDAFNSYARYWVAGARLTSMQPEEILESFSIDGFEHVEGEVENNRGLILALPHLGIWDLGGAWLTLKGCPMTTVVEALEPPDLFDWFRAQREQLGLTIHELGPGTSGRLVTALRAGRLVGLVADRDIAGNGVEVEFFGERTTLPGGPAALALRTGACLFPSIVYQSRGLRGHGVILPALEIKRSGDLRADVSRVTQMLAHAFEGLIRRAPSQWHLFQPNWPDDREKYG